MYEMKISTAEEIAAEKETYNESNKFTCKRCHEQQQEDEKKERMEETIQELKKKIEELQERITTLMEIKDAENMIDVSYKAIAKFGHSI